MAEHLTFNQGVTGSRPVRPTSGTNLPPNDLVNLLKGHLIDKSYRNVAQSCSNRFKQAVSCQCEGLQLTTFSDALAAYRICAKAEGKSPKTVNWIGDAVRYFSQFLGDQANDLDSVNAQSLRQFILALQTKKTFSKHRFTPPQEKPVSPDTVASYTRAIKSFFSFLEREELIPSNPVAKVKVPKTPRRNMPTFSEEDLARLFAQPDKKTSEGYRDYTIMLTLLDTGIRVSELCGLGVGDVDLANGYLRVMGKGQRERYVPIGRKLTKALLKYKLLHRAEANGSDNFFLTRDGRPINKARVQKFIRRYGERAGIKTRPSPHTFRSTKAVLYLRNGGDPFSLQKALGHSSLVMTRRYSNLANSDVRSQHLRYGVVDRLKV